MRFEIRPSKNGQCYVVQKGKNGEILNTSETFTSHKNAVKNIKAVYTQLQGSVNVRVYDFVNRHVYTLTRFGLTGPSVLAKNIR